MVLECTIESPSWWQRVLYVNLESFSFSSSTKSLIKLSSSLVSRYHVTQDAANEMQAHLGLASNVPLCHPRRFGWPNPVENTNPPVGINGSHEYVCRMNDHTL